MEMNAVAGPKLPNLADLKSHLRGEPLYYQVLEDYLQNAAQMINGLRARLEAYEGQERMDEEPIREEGSEFQPTPLEPLLDEESGDEAREVQAGASERERAEEVREIVLRSRTVYVPASREGSSGPVEEVPEAFHVPVVEGLPERFRELLVEPQIDPYRVVGGGGRPIGIRCGFCAKEFGTLKGWRIHAARMHTRNGFCQKCGHFVHMPRASTAEEIRAAMELHSMEWCPKAAKAVVSERTVKRRRLELVGRMEEAENYFIPSV